MYRALFHAAALVVVTAMPVWAQDLAAPEGDVILTVSGNIEMTNVGETAQFDLALLETLEATSFETSTIWTEGTQTFTGVSLKALLDELGVEGETLSATAINDYAVEIPMSDAVEGGALIAYHMDGQTMSVRDKGPLWIVYPYDVSADFRTEVIYSRSIWQLDRINVLN